MTGLYYNPILASVAQRENSQREERFVSNKTATAYATASAALLKIEQNLTAARRELDEQSVQVAIAAEEQRREHEKALYEQAKELKEAQDKQAREDAEREREFETRELNLTAAEDAFLEILGIKRTFNGEGLPTVKQIRDAFTAHVTEVDRKAEGRGKGIALAAYETQKKVDEAAQATSKALLEQENNTLKTRVQALETQNAALIKEQATVLGQMKDLASNGLQAAAGLVGKANDAMQTAVSQGQNGGLRR